MSEVKISKSILIIKASASSLTAPEQFLKNRDWLVFSTADMKVGLGYIVQKKPSFVLVCVDHPSPAVRKLPKLLVQAFPVCVIGYVEASNAKSFRLLTDAHTEYKVNPPVTGPAIERAVNKYVKDQEKRSQDVKSPKGQQISINIKPKVSNESEDATEISIDKDKKRSQSIELQKTKQNNKSSDRPALITSGSEAEVQADEFSFEIVNQIISQASHHSEETQVNPTEESAQLADQIEGFLSGDHGDNIQMNEQEMSEKSGKKKKAKITKSSSSEDLNSDAESGEAAEFGISREARDRESLSEDSELSDGQPGELGQGRAGSLVESSDSEDSEATEESDASGMGRFAGKSSTYLERTKSKKVKKGEYSIDSGPSKTAKAPQTITTYSEDDYVEEADSASSVDSPVDVDSLVGELKSKKKAGKGDAPVVAKEIEEGQGAPKNAEAELFHFDDEETPAKTKRNKSLILEGVTQALMQTVEDRDGVVKTELEGSSHVACIVIESTRFSGYLVSAMGKDIKIDDQFVNGIKDKLFKYLKDSGEEISENENLQLKIKQIDFEGWALHYAEFLRKAIHQGDEVAMAFFPEKSPTIAVGESPTKEMASIKIDDLEADKPLEFNIYIYLPTNKRYVLYTPKGSVFYSKQKDKLKSQDVELVHMLKSELGELTKYKVQNFLNNLVEEYHFTKQAKTSVA